jgi:hypothetical protein
MLIKTEKGRQELRAGHRSLGQRERAILLLADGQKPEASLAALFGGDGRALLDHLLSGGFIERKGSHAPAPAPLPRAAPAVAHGDPFAGTRSLATARMFLFDLSERLFAPRNKALALHYRDALREARDASAMLRVGRAMIVDVERLAGSERADGISERLAKLLPADLLLDMA